MVSHMVSHLIILVLDSIDILLGVTMTHVLAVVMDLMKYTANLDGV